MQPAKYKLTYPQKNIWLVEKVYNNTSVNNICGVLNIENDFNVDYCINAVNKMVELNEGLRIRIENKHNSIMQYIEAYSYFNVEVFNMESNTTNEILDFEKQLTRIYIDIEKEKGYKFAIINKGNGKGTIVVKLHHIISDAWTYGRVATILAEYIEAQENNEEIIKIAPSYVDYINSENEYINSEKFTLDEEYWISYLNGINEVVGLKNKDNKTSIAGIRYSKKLDNEINNKILKYSKENKISPYTIFMSALAIYIHRTTSKEDFVIGTPVLNRSNFKEKQMMGMFVSTMPVRYIINEQNTFLEICKNNATEFMTLFRHSKYPYSKTLEHIHENTEIKDNLYKVVLSYQNTRAKYTDEEKYNTNWIFNGVTEDDFAFHIMNMDSDETMQIHIDYKKEMFEEIEIEYIYSRIMEVIKDGINNNKKIKDIEIMTKEEKEKLIYSFNDTYSDYPRDKTIQEIITNYATNEPNKIALMYKDSKLTYKELDEKSNQVANVIKEKNISRNDVIAITMDKSLELIIGIVGILKSGCAYLPIDNELPSERINYMLDNSDTKYIITKKNIDCKEYNIESISIDLNNEIYKKYSTKNINTGEYSDRAFVMYTSGTTGMPKGAIVTHQNVLKLSMGITHIDISEIDNVFVAGNIIFDASMFEMWLGLLNNKAIILIDKDTLTNSEKFISILKTIKKSIVVFTTQLFHQYSTYDLSAFDNVRYIIAGGDKMLYKYAKNILDKCKNTELINIYGPTECTAATTTYLVNNDTPINIPIGKPINNTRCYILDEKKRLCPMYVEGELYIAGEGVGEGYINNIELTNRVYQNLSICDKIEKTYSSGDIVSVNNEGNIFIHGRKDNQIKIRGYRIEISEIENTVLKYNDIDEVCVKLNSNNENKYLSMYFVSKNNINIIELKKYMITRLPIYMIPNQIIKIEKMPLTSSGKIDKNKLDFIIEEKKEIIFPKNKVEEIILNVVQELINAENISADDDIFEIGIDSIMVTRLISILEKSNINLKYSEIFAQRTIINIAKEYENQKENKYSKIINEYDYTKINNVLQTEYLYNKMEEDCSILLTGATGFLGIHLLKDLVNITKGNIYCIVRDTTICAEERLLNKLNYYFNKKEVQAIQNKIKILKYDILNDNFKDDIVDIIKNNNIKLVINSAATVKHYGKESDFVDINVNAVINLINACKKTDIRFVHISTLSVSGNGVEAGFTRQESTEKLFKETNLYVGQQISNLYTYTKYMAEIKILEAINEGLMASIIRVGNLMSRYSDGKFQENINDNGFVQRIKFVIDSKMVPKTVYEKNYLEFSPVDKVSNLIIKILNVKKSIPVFHLYNHNHIEIKDFIEKTEKILNIKINVLSDNEFIQKIKENISNYGIIYIDVNEKDVLDYSSSIIINEDITLEKLSELKQKWIKIDGNYLIKFLNSIGE